MLSKHSEDLEISNMLTCLQILKMNLMSPNLDNQPPDWEAKHIFKNSLDL